jgi:histidine triad (HIT) family protein
MNPDCIFCQIIQGNTQANIVYKDDMVTAFRDIHPLTPVHVLVVPNRHIASVNQVTEEDEMLLGHLVTVARRLAAENGIDQSGYRLMINTGPDAGQTVHHIHLHILGGQHMRIRLEG